MRVLLSTLLVALVAGSAVPSPTPAAPHRATLADLAFMTGCWRGASGPGTTIEEYYTPPSDNLMLGVSRYTKGASVVDYEFSIIRAEGDSDLVLTPHPKGQAAADFHMSSLKPGAVEWSNPKHDFPQRIKYRKLGADSLVARIEGPGDNGTQSSEWRMGKTACGK